MQLLESSSAFLKSAFLTSAPQAQFCPQYDTAWDYDVTAHCWKVHGAGKILQPSQNVTAWTANLSFLS